MEENLFHCIPQHKKPFPLYPTTEENLFHYEIHWKKTSGVVGYNGQDFSMLHPTIFLWCIYYDENVILQCGIQRRKIFCVVGYNTLHKKILLWCRLQQKKNSCVWDTTEKNLLAILRLFSVVSHNRKNLFRCIPHQRKTFSDVSHNGKNSSVVSHIGKKKLK